METDNAPMSTPGVASADSGLQKGSVGALLHATRLRLGVDLVAVAEALHIRAAYLEAIEAGDYEALPGGTYAVGFIRSYADQLGLDGKEMVRRFKLETGTQPQLSPQPVNFPKPVTTLGMPIGAIVTGVVVAVGLAFAAWYLLSGNDSTTLLPKLPAALNETINAPVPRDVAPPAVVSPEPVKVEPVKVEAEKPMESPKPEAAKPIPAPAPAPAPVAPPKPEAVKPAPVPVAVPKPAEAPKPVTEAPKPVVEPPKPVAEPPKPAVEAPKPVAAPPASPPRPNVEESADTPPVGPETVARTARVYGEDNAGARVELVATADAWVQVTENGSLVLTRLLHAGDRFRVPNRPGLTLMTGNAGGIEVRVDGGKVAPLGNSGQVVRDVLLDPERLRSGR